MAQASVTRYQKNFQDVHPFSNNNLNVFLAANTGLVFTVPGLSTQLYRARFRSASTAEIYVGLNVSAAIPTSNTATNAPYQEMLPFDECRYVKGGDVLSFISSGTPGFSMQLLLLQDTTGM